MKPPFYQLEWADVDYSVPGCLGPSSGQRDDCVKASECCCLSDLLYCTMKVLVKRSIVKLNHCTKFSFPKILPERKVTCFLWRFNSHFLSVEFGNEVHTTFSTWQECFKYICLDFFFFFFTLGSCYHLKYFPFKWSEKIGRASNVISVLKKMHFWY